MNGNTLITLGPQGTLLEVTANGEQVWRFVSPCLADGKVCGLVRQGDQRLGKGFSLFRAMKYAPDYAAFEGKDLSPTRYLEG